MMAAPARPAFAQQGMALISAMLLLLVVTIMAISMFRSYGMQEKIAGNVREKQRAFSAAVSAQQYAEWYLLYGNPPSPGQCTGSVLASPGQICTNQLNTAGPNGTGDYTILPWNNGVRLTPFTAGNGNGVTNTVSNLPTTTGSGVLKQDSYYKTPSFYITDLGAAAGGGELYQIDAVGYGGTPNAVAVVESTYLITSSGPQTGNW